MRFSRFRMGVFCRCEPARHFANYRRFVKAQLGKVPNRFDQAETHYESEADDYYQRSQKMHVPPVAHRGVTGRQFSFLRRVTGISDVEL